MDCSEMMVGGREGKYLGNVSQLPVHLELDELIPAMCFSPSDYLMRERLCSNNETTIPLEAGRTRDGVA